MFRLVLVCALVAVSMGAVPRPIRPMLDGRIVGGEPAKIEDHPYQVSLQRWGSHSCGGSIVSKNRIVTAAHCTDGASASSLSVRIGSSSRGSGGKVLLVQKILQNPDYDAWTIDYDSCVLVVPDIEFSDSAQPIRLPSENEEVAVGTLGTISGWGTLSSGGSLPIQLQRVKVPKVTDARCKAAYGSSAITDRMTCYGLEEGGKDSCQGDSGGPLNVDGVLAGIVSWGAGCAAPRYPGVYARTSNPEILSHIHNSL